MRFKPTETHHKRVFLLTWRARLVRTDYGTNGEHLVTMRTNTSAMSQLGIHDLSMSRLRALIAISFAAISAQAFASGETFSGTVSKSSYTEALFTASQSGIYTFSDAASSAILFQVFQANNYSPVGTGTVVGASTSFDGYITKGVTYGIIAASVSAGPTTFLTTVTNSFGATISGYNIVAAPAVPVLPAVPEPETYAMLLAGLGLIATIAVRGRQKN